MKSRSRMRMILFGGLMAIAAGSSPLWAATLSGSDDVFSFDMWCQEMKLYPSQRCDARRPDDVKAYEQYRTTAERYATQRAEQAKRDQQINQKLNADPLNRQRVPLSR